MGAPVRPHRPHMPKSASGAPKHGAVDGVVVVMKIGYYTLMLPACSLRACNNALCCTRSQQIPKNYRYSFYFVTYWLPV